MHKFTDGPKNSIEKDIFVSLLAVSNSKHIFNRVCALALIAAFCVPPLTATASPADQVAADRKALDAAVKEYSGGQNRINEIQEEINSNNEKLDTTLELELEAQTALLNRLEGIYRDGDAGFLDALFGAQSINEFFSRWDLFTRISEADARLLSDLETARRQIEASANSLMEKQVEILEENEKLQKRMQAAQAQFASSEKLLADYNKRIKAERARAINHARKSNSSVSVASGSEGNSMSSSSSSNAWKTSLASHYSLTFGSSGKARGASGKSITPRSMMVAHKSLPFGTKIEFEYKGRFAVASVEDRGPYSGNREWDLGPGTARSLNFKGVGNVKWRILN